MVARPSLIEMTVLTPLPSDFLLSSTSPLRPLASKPSRYLMAELDAVDLAPARLRLMRCRPTHPRAPAPSGIGQFALELAALLDQRSDARRRFVGRGLERGGDGAQLLVAVRQPLARGLAGQRLDTAYARSKRRFRRRS